MQMQARRWGLSLTMASMLLLAGACGGDDEAVPTTNAQQPPDPGPDAQAPGLDGGARPEPDAGPPRLGFSFGGPVAAAVHAGQSWYVGGAFTTAQLLPAPRLLAVDATGTPSASCDLGAGFDGSVEAAVVVGTSIYVGGFFTHYKGASANYVAKLDASTCALDTTFSPGANNGFQQPVRALAVSGTSIFAGGDLYRYRGVLVPQGVAKLDLVSGALDPTFDPPGAAGFDRTVFALAVSGASLYVGGQFETYNSLPARGLAKLDATTGDLDTTFTSQVGFANGFDGWVRALAVAGTSLYVGGDFRSYTLQNNTFDAKGVAKLDLTTGVLDSTLPPGGFDGSVRALAVSGTSIFVGGSFTSYGDYPGSALELAKLSLATNELDTTFSPPGAGRNGLTDGVGVMALSVIGGSLYVGGNFTAHRGVPGSARNIAKLDPITGVLLPSFKPPAHDANGTDGEVHAIVAAGSTVFVGGAFHGYGGRTFNGIAKVDDKTLELDRVFSPAGANGFDGPVTSLAVSGTSLYVGGRFLRYRGVPDSARNIAKLDLITGAIDTTFSPPGTTENGLDGEVDALAVSGTSLFIGGRFTKFRFLVPTLSGLAKVSLTTGELDPSFNPPNVTAPRVSGFDRRVRALAVSGSSLYLGGSFDSYGVGAPAPAIGLAKVDVTNGALDTTFSPPAPAMNGFDNPAVYAMTVSGGSLYVGGEFTAYRGETSSGLVKLDATSGALDKTFGPGVSGGLRGAVYALTASATSLYAAGLFGSESDVNVVSLAKLDLANGALGQPFAPPGGVSQGIDGRGAALATDGSTLLVGGDFGYYGGTKWLDRAAVLDATTGALR